MSRDSSSYQDFRNLLGLENTLFNYSETSISNTEGEFIKQIIESNSYSQTIEIGCALGIGSLFICKSILHNSESNNYIIDPYQNTYWQGIGISNLRDHNINNFTLIEKPSEIALPELLNQKKEFDFGFIDGWHTFDHALLDFFYLNRMIRVGGTIVIDDANWNSISKVLDYIRNYPCYELFFPEKIPISKPISINKLLLKSLIKVSKLVTADNRRKIFSRQILNGELNSTRYPNIVALKKICCDDRNFDWFVPF